MIIPSTLLAKCWNRIRLIAIETMKGAFGNEGALRYFSYEDSEVRTRDAVTVRTSQWRAQDCARTVAAPARWLKTAQKSTTANADDVIALEHQPIAINVDLAPADDQPWCRHAL
jgi:hypothetical protein